MTIREEIEALVARERPGWRVVEVIEVNDESGPSFDVTAEAGGRRATLRIGEGGRIVERPRTDDDTQVGQENMEIIARRERERGAWGIDEA